MYILLKLITNYFVIGKSKFGHFLVVNSVPHKGHFVKKKVAKKMSIARKFADFGPALTFFISQLNQ